LYWHNLNSATETELPFTALPAAIAFGNPDIVSKLIDAGVLPIPISSIPEPDRAGKLCSFVALRTVSAPSSTPKQRNEVKALGKVASLVVLNTPNHIDLRNNEEISQIKGFVRESINIAIADRRSRFAPASLKK
jgi:hypothetical protein